MVVDTWCAGAAEKSSKHAGDQRAHAIIEAMKDRMKLREQNNTDLFELIRSVQVEVLVLVLVPTHEQSNTDHL